MFYVLPDDAKIALVSPSDKGTSKKNKSQIYNQSVFQHYSRKYIRRLKRFLEAGINKFFSPFLSTYWKSYGTHHNFIRLVGECRERLDCNYGFLKSF